jgi:hypothetical protein
MPQFRFQAVEKPGTRPYARNKGLQSLLFA